MPGCAGGPDLLREDVQAEVFSSTSSELYVTYFAPDAVDLGGGSTGTGRLPSGYLTVEYWQEEFMTQQHIDNIEGKTLDQLFDLDATVVYTFAEVEAMDSDYFGKSTPYVPQDDDMWIATPWLPDSGRSEDVFAVYRNVDGNWKVVGID
jgi:hypothetical protein